MQEGRSFRQVDYVVIAVLYIGNIVDVWTGGWVKLTDDVLFGDDDDDNEVLRSKRGNVRIQNADPTSVLVLGNSLSVLCVKCVLCLVLAFAADLRNRKFLLYFGSLCLWVGAPIVGIATSLTRSSALALSLSWLAAVLFVTAPLKYCLIFNQRLNPSRDQTRIVVALFELIVSSCAFMLHSCFSNPKDIQVSVLVTVWAVVVSPLGITIILLTVIIRSHCTSDTPKEKNFKELIIGIRQDVVVKGDDVPQTAHQKKIAPLRFVIFILLLCPSIAVSIIFEAHEKLTHTLTKEAKLERSWFEFIKALINLLAIPVISLLVSLSRGSKGALWDYMVLAFAHVLNIVTMLLIYLYFHNNDFSNVVVIPSPNQSDPISLVPGLGVPGKGMAIVRVFFHGLVEQYHKQYFFQSSLNENPKKVYDYILGGGELVPVKSGSLIYDFSVWEDRGPRLNQSIVVEEKKRYFFVATGTTLSLKELVYVPNVRDFIPGIAERVLVLSSIAEGAGSIYAKKGKLVAWQNGTVIKSSPIPETNSSVQWRVPAVLTIFRFGLGSQVQIKLEPYREIVLLVSWQPGPKTVLAAYITALYNVSDFRNATETLLQITNGVQGVVAAAATIGYVQFFWMEAPFRLRTTLFACTMVANEVAKWLVDLLVEEFTDDVALALLILSASAGLAHVSLGAFYDYELKKLL